MLDGQRTDARALTDAIDDAAKRIVIGEVGATLAACAEVADKRGGLAYLGLVTVAPALQGGGLGRRLLRAVEEVARTAFAASRIEMTVIAQRAELIAWYERRGYALTGERRPFPLDDPRFGLPKTRELEFVVLEKVLD